MREPLLFTRFPRLRGRVPWMQLGTMPTPVEPMTRLGEHLGCDNLWVKRDDLTGESYGGNKVRKLEFTLAQARDLHRDLIITSGAVGSNHVLATTLYARDHGLQVLSIFVPQPIQENLRTNLLCNCVQGCRIEYLQRMNLLPLAAAWVYGREWTRNRRRPYLLYIGGSNTAGILGYVEAALEIADQVKTGQLPLPEFIFVPVGSCGTFAGLALGLQIAGLPSIPVGVRVSGREYANESVTAYLANRALRYLRRLDPSVPDARVDKRRLFMLHDYCGDEYARYTVKGVEAVALAQDLEGIKLEGTYSGKAMAAFLDFMRPRARAHVPALFINTYNSRPLDPFLAGCPGPSILPSALQTYFRDDVAAVGR
jgi:1-aminocyclopropane-1-carboxylate deaminase/D-cysteine desulfhydrase-like pyridoxal-dependent ACC family enzyme